MRNQQPTKISPRQFKILVILFVVGTSILILPSGMADIAKQDAWIGVAFGILLTVLIIFFYNFMAKWMAPMSFVEFNEYVLGKWVGKLISFLFVFYSFLNASSLLFYVGNFMNTQIMGETPIEVINLLFALILVMGIRSGIEVVARTAEILFPWFFFLLLILILFLFPQAELKNLQPVMESEFKPLLHDALMYIGTATLPLLVLFMVFPKHVSHPEKCSKALMKGTLFAGILMLIITALTILVLGADLTARQMYASYFLAKKISVGHFLERIEALLAGLWLITIYFKSTLYFFASVSGIAHVFGVSDYRRLSTPMGMLLVTFSIIVYPNTVYMQNWDSTVYTPYVITIGLVLPLFLILVSKLKEYRTKMKKKNG